MKFSHSSIILYSCLLIACNSADPKFLHEEVLPIEANPLQSITDITKIEVKPPFIILQKRDSLLHSFSYPTKKKNTGDTIFLKDSLYVADAMHLTSPLTPYMENYYTNPNMKRVYVNDRRIVFCYGYKKQIDFMDSKFNLINRVKFKFTNPAYINSRNNKDIILSYTSSYLGKQFFYTLFRNENQESFSPNTFLEVYDLDGNPIIRYLLNGRHPKYFAVDEKSFTLYGSGSYDVPEKNLLVYKLKGLSGQN